MLTDTYVITGIHANLFSVMWSVQNNPQLTSNVESLILKENPTIISFDKLMPNTGNGVIILTTKIYNNRSGSNILGYDKRKIEYKSYTNMEGMVVKKQAEKTTKNWQQSASSSTNSTQVSFIHENTGQTKMKIT